MMSFEERRPARERNVLERLQRECPEGHVVAVLHRHDLAGFEPGDIVLAQRPDNGKRGNLRVRAAVVVGRYVPEAGAC